MSQGEILCRLADLPAEGSLRLDFQADEYGHGLCVIRKDSRTYAYLNRCAHQDTAMDWVPGQFLDASGEFIVCAMHGAHFRVEDGYCVLGPCRGRFLRAVRVVEDGEYLCLDEPGLC